MEGNLSYSRRQNQSAFDKAKKKKKRKKKPKEGKRSSASSASASGSPDFNGPYPAKTQSSFSCPSILNNSEKGKSYSDSSKEDSFSKVNDCLRWPAHSSYAENSFRSEVIGRFPVAGETEEEESERIAIYKMNRRKRYLAAQQALINKYPDISVYASSSGSSSGHDTNEERLRISSSRSIAPSGDSKPVFHSADASPDLTARESQENIHKKYFSNADVALALSRSGSAGGKREVRKNVFSGI